MNYTEMVTEYLSLPDRASALAYMNNLNRNLSVTQMYDFHETLVRAMKDRLNSNNHYVYLLTFTLDPKKQPHPLSSRAIESIESIIAAQGRRAALQVLKYSFVREYHKDGRPHWHALMVTKKCLRKDRFTPYLKKFGNIDISKSRSQQDGDVLNYMAKEGDIIEVI